MAFFSFLSRYKKNNKSIPKAPAGTYKPELRAADFCVHELLPANNKEFVREQLDHFNALVKLSKAKHVYQQTFSRGNRPFPLINQEIRFNYVAGLLTRFQFHKANQILYENDQLLDCDSGNIRAFGFVNFTIFLETEGEFIKDAYFTTGLIVSVEQLHLLESALYALGEECSLMVADWNGRTLVDLTNRQEVSKFLMWYWK